MCAEIFWWYHFCSSICPSESAVLNVSRPLRHEKGYGCETLPQTPGAGAGPHQGKMGNGDTQADRRHITSKEGLLHVCFVFWKGKGTKTFSPFEGHPNEEHFKGHHGKGTWSESPLLSLCRCCLLGLLYTLNVNVFPLIFSSEVRNAQLYLTPFTPSSWRTHFICLTTRNVIKIILWSWNFFIHSE